MTKIPVIGLAELHRKLEQLPARIEKNIVRSGVRAGAQVIRRAILAKSPGGTAKDITLEVSRSGSRKAGAIMVHIRLADSKFYWYFLEFGTYASFIGTYKKKPRWMKRRRIPRGAAPRPFMRPAFDENIDRAIDAMKQKIAQRIEKEAAK